MKRYILLPVIGICILSITQAQKITQSQAKQLLSNSLAYLKTNDTSAFIAQYALDNKPWPYHHKPFTHKQALANFAALRIFLDTALNQNIRMEGVEIEKQKRNDSGYCAPYKIKMWFKYDDYYQKGFGFYVDYINDKWCYRYSPDYSTLLRPKE